jgi:transposase
MKSQARVLLPNRKQLELRAADLESLLSAGHRARLVWAYVERQDLEAFYADIRAVEGGVGRAAIAPEILLALWLYATIDGVGSAREIARLTEAHDAYRWLCGGVQVNHHTISDFRKSHGEALDELLSVSIASLMAVGVVKLKQVAQDGLRVRAHAGAGSFRRKEKLEGYLEAARTEVSRLKAELEADPGEGQRAREAAKLRAAREREACLEQALARLSEIEGIKKRQGKKPEEARASMTDAEARS